MPPDQLGTAAKVVAYQTVTLAELRRAFDEVDVDLNDALERERGVSHNVESIRHEFDDVRARLKEMGADFPAGRAGSKAIHKLSTATPSRYAVPVVPAESDFDQLLALAEARLDLLGIDLTRDPLLQVLPPSEIDRSLRSFADTYGDVSWDTTDWAVVLSAGALATLLDVILIRIPHDSAFLGTHYKGSPLTKWLQDRHRAEELHARYFKKFEKAAKVPYDAPHSRATNNLVSGMRPATHRIQSLGHDPALGFLSGVADIMHGTGTYITGSGQLVQITTAAEPVDLITALITQTRHLLSDVYTPAGLPPPLFSLLQLGQMASPFALTPSGDKVPWTEVARYMYTNGYDLRHFFAMGVTPGVVKATIRGYWLLNNYATGGTHRDRDNDRAKLASMLLMGHTIAASGTLLKTGLLYGMNPAALNYNQIIAMVPATVAWIRETTARDHRIAGALQMEWQSLLAQSGLQ